MASKLVFLLILISALALSLVDAQGALHRDRRSPVMVDKRNDTAHLSPYPAPSTLSSTRKTTKTTRTSTKKQSRTTRRPTKTTKKTTKKTTTKHASTDKTQTPSVTPSVSKTSTIPVNPSTSPAPLATLPPILVKNNTQLQYTNGTRFSGRGINLGHWFTIPASLAGLQNVSEYEFFNVSDTRWNQTTTLDLMNLWIDNAMQPQDFSLIREMGFNFVRLGLHYRNFQWADGTWIPRTEGNKTLIEFGRLDRAIQMATDAGLYVSLSYHSWWGKDVYGKEAISIPAGPDTFPKVLVEQKGLQDKASDFLGNLTFHVMNVPGILAIELLDEASPSFGHNLSQVLYNAVRAVDPNRVVVRYFSSDRVDPVDYNWASTVYSFNVADEGLSSNGLGIFEAGVKDKTKDAFKIPYYVSAWEMKDWVDTTAAIEFMNGLTPKIQMWALWTYKGVFNETLGGNDTLVSYPTQYRVNLRTDSFDAIQSVWRKMGDVDAGKLLTDWGRSFLG